MSDEQRKLEESTEITQHPESEGLTQIVSKKSDLSVFDSETVIRPIDMSASELTKYIKEVTKSQGSLLEQQHKNTAATNVSPFESLHVDRVVESNQASRSPDRSPRPRPERPKAEYHRESFFSQLSKKLNHMPPAGVWILGIGAAFILALAFAVGTSHPPTDSSPASDSQVTTTNELSIPAPALNFEEEAIVQTQLKVEFLSGLHSSIETTRTHAPNY